MSDERPLVRQADGTYRVPLTQGKFAVIDACDVESVSLRNWHFSKRNYARSRHSSLHRFILSPPKDLEVDHIDGDGLNCRRANMRIATHAQNMQNKRRAPTTGKTSKFKGVCWDPVRLKWRATICYNSVPCHIGRYDSEQDAANAYIDAAREHFGEFATGYAD